MFVGKEISAVNKLFRLTNYIFLYKLKTKGGCVMIFGRKDIILKDGTEAYLKSPEAENAEEMANYVIKTRGESDFLNRYPEELTTTVEGERRWIEEGRASDYKLVITCFVNGKIAGSAEVRFLQGLKMRHRAGVGIAILKEYWGRGIGSTIFTELISVAKERGVEIMELEYFEGNVRGEALYKKFGFKTVSFKPNAIKLKDGTYLKEFYMQKYL